MEEYSVYDLKQDLFLKISDKVALPLMDTAARKWIHSDLNGIGVSKMRQNRAYGKTEPYVGVMYGGLCDVLLLKKGYAKSHENLVMKIHASGDINRAGSDIILSFRQFVKKYGLKKLIQETAANLNGYGSDKEIQDFYLSGRYSKNGLNGNHAEIAKKEAPVTA